MGPPKPTLLLDRCRARRLLKDSRDVLHSFTESSPRCGQRQRRYAKINEWSYCPSLARGVSFVMWRDAVDTTVSIITVRWLVGVWLICARRPHQLLVEIRKIAKQSGSAPPKTPPTAEMRCAADGSTCLVLHIATNCWWKTTKKMLFALKLVWIWITLILSKLFCAIRLFKE